MLGLMSDSICRKDSSRPVGRQLLVGAVPIPTRCALLGTNTSTNTNPSTNTKTGNNEMGTFLSIVLIQIHCPSQCQWNWSWSFFAHILLFKMTLFLSFIPRILPQSLVFGNSSSGTGILSDSIWRLPPPAHKPLPFARGWDVSWWKEGKRLH